MINYLKILNNWSISESPANKGDFVIISTNMHPILQISTGVEYSIDPSNISGARYHKVTTSWVYGLIGIEKVLAKPKSAILIVPIHFLNYLIYFNISYIFFFIYFIMFFFTFHSKYFFIILVFTRLIYQKILWFKISVQDSS